MEKERLIKGTIRRFNPMAWERINAENKMLNEENRRLKTELEETKLQVGRFHSDIVMHSAVDTLLHQAKSLSTLIFDSEGTATRAKTDH